MEDHDNNQNYQDNDENVPPNYDTNQIMLAMKGHRDSILEQLMKQMSDIQAQLGTLTSKKVNTTKYSNKENIAPSDNINPKTGQPSKRYYWSCGCCPYWVKYCTDKRKGYKMDAIFKNCMNGSSSNCL